MRLYFLVLALDDIERDALLKFIAAPDLLHLRAALMEVAPPVQPPAPEWWVSLVPGDKIKPRLGACQAKFGDGRVWTTTSGVPRAVTWEMTVTEPPDVPGRRIQVSIPSGMFPGGLWVMAGDVERV